MTRLLNNKTASHKLTMALTLAVAATCNVAQANPITGALGEIKPLADVRVRYEWVEQAPAPGTTTPSTTANAINARARLGFETGKAWDTSLLVEGEFLTPLESNFRSDNAVPGFTQYPVVADPEAYELNRFTLTNTSITNTTLTLGRQRINLDDQRFVGNVGWRMNEQTYDSLRAVNKSFDNKLTTDVTYSNRVNRVYGPDSPQGVYKGDFELINVAYQFGLGKLTAFDYLLHFDPLLNSDFPGLTAAQATPLNPARVSTQTWGARFAGAKSVGKIKLAYIGSYAKQEDYGSNPTGNFDNSYYLGELTGTFRQWTLGGGIERLGGDGTRGFATPLATLHKFQGWVDKFLTTPDRGIKDTYATGTYAVKGVGPFETIAFTLMYHDYVSTRQDVSYGHESNAQVAAKWQRLTTTVKYGDYGIGTPIRAIQTNAATVLTDTKKFWLQFDYLW